MDIISNSAVLIVILVAIMSTRVILNALVPPAAHGRFLAIDGLRGYLAVFVFLYHSYIWYQYLRAGAWTAPESKLFIHLGQDGVALFFMITGFLFFSKIIDSKRSGIDWLRLYVSRVLRLTPLYVFSVFLLVGIVFTVTGGALSEPVLKVGLNILQWLGFTIFGNPDINGLEDTYVVDAGVTWSLVYEWFFYMALPLVAIFIGGRASNAVLAISAVSVIAFGLYYLKDPYLLFFVPGMVAAVLVRFECFTKLSRTNTVSILILILLAYVVGVFPQIYNKSIAKLVVAGVFCLIAGGNSFFGILESRLSRALGEMAYGIYLLHGLVLFITFRFVIGFSEARGFTEIQHWEVIVLLTPVLVLVCGIAFKFIEKPSMKNVGPLTEWIRSISRKKDLPANESV